MALLVLLRHGATEWNAAGRLQGRSDLALSATGREAVARWRLPDAIVAAQWVSSPLQRCRETAAVLLRSHPAARAVRIEPRLVEMSFGDWEGRTLPELRAAYGAEMVEREGRGLDFRAPGGESPRDVQTRLLPWLQELVAGRQATLAITHKGVMRALYALASGWDMRDKPPARLHYEVLQGFTVDDAGIRVERLNMPLVAG